MELTSADLAFLKSKIRELKQEEYHSSDFRMDGIAAEGFSAVLGGEAATESAAEVAQDGMASQEAAEAGGMESGGGEAAAGGSFDAMA